MAHTPKRTMVCVTVQKTCERLIREGAALSGDEELFVVHVVKTGGAVLGADSDSEALDYLFRVSRQYGAEMEMLRSDDVIGKIVDFAKRNEIACLVIGTAGGRSYMSVADQLREKLPGVTVHEVP